MVSIRKAIANDFEIIYPLILEVYKNTSLTNYDHQYSFYRSSQKAADLGMFFLQSALIMTVVHPNIDLSKKPFLYF